MKYSALSDETLCQLASQQDAEAEEALVVRYSRLVRACARPLFLMGGDSEDLTQEGMLGLIKAIRDYSPERGCSFRTFAEVCVRNRMISAIRSAAGKQHTPLNDSIPIETPLFDESYVSPLPENDPETLLISRETLQEQLEQLRKKLSVFEAKVLGLYLGGLSYLEIADQVERPLKSVDNAVQRIRRKLEGESGGDSGSTKD
jgi:RNA polymerase sporulation-specific sigma factor